eukprot:3506507-Rhodomonas_salina.1
MAAATWARARSGTRGRTRTTTGRITCRWATGRRYRLPLAPRSRLRCLPPHSRTARTWSVVTRGAAVTWALTHTVSWAG